MRFKHSLNINPQRFHALGLCILQNGMDADLFVSGAANGWAPVEIIGVSPCAELVFEETTTNSQISNFVFADDTPALGYLSYEFGMLLRGVPITKTPHVPLGHLKKYTALLRYDKTTQELGIESQDSALFQRLKELAHAAPAGERSETALDCAPMLASLSQAEYQQGVVRTLEFIRSGLAYQLNLSILFSSPCRAIHSAALFQDLLKNRPAAFYTLFHTRGADLLSTSPERFLSVRDGHVLTQPIKGTTHVAPHVRDVSGLIQQLRGSEKESAELSMIVDLLRNDISINCEYGSVTVEDHKSVFAVDNLLQMYSNVLGRLRSGRSCVDLLLDAFPGGSITGCPKKKAMELIDKLEPHPRGVYCGAFVAFYDRRNMDSSIAIRSAELRCPQSAEESPTLNFYAGSGIVVDSKPESEYAETLAKAEKFFNLVQT